MEDVSIVLCIGILLQMGDRVRSISAPVLSISNKMEDVGNANHTPGHKVTARDVAQIRVTLARYCALMVVVINAQILKGHLQTAANARIHIAPTSRLYYPVVLANGVQNSQEDCRMEEHVAQTFVSQTRLYRLMEHVEAVRRS